MMKDMMKMMQQAKMLQKNMENVQAQLAQTNVTGQASGGAVKITLSCSNEVKNVEISPEAMDDAEMLQDMVQLALEDALTQAKTKAESEMKAVTGGLQIPGM